MFRFWKVNGSSEPIRVGIRPPWIDQLSLITYFPNTIGAGEYSRSVWSKVP